MYIFTKLKDKDNKYDISDIEFEVDAILREELIEEFYMFLAACGFSVKDLLKEDYETGSSED